MKPRARRVTHAAAVLGAGVLGVLVVTHWGTVRDHVEAWWFLVTRETGTIAPGREAPPVLYMGYSAATDAHIAAEAEAVLGAIASSADRPVIFERNLGVVVKNAMAKNTEWALSRAADSEEARARVLLTAADWRLVTLQLPRVIVAYPPAQP
jgi:hypothetical protein